MAILKNLTINDTGYLQIPSGTIAQRPASPTEGMIRYNTDYRENEYYNGTEWISTGTSDFSIVYDGLILLLDPADPDCFSNGQTTCNNLITYGLVTGASGTPGTGTHTPNTANFPTYSSNNGGIFDFTGGKGMNCEEDLGYHTELSLSMWFYKTSSGTEYFTDARNDSGQWFLSNYTGQNINYTDAMRYNFDATYNASNADFLNNWHYMVVTSDASRSYLYLDGYEISVHPRYRTSYVSTTSIDEDLGKNFRIGTRYTTSAQWTGYMGPIAIYNRVLSSSEVDQNFNAIRSRFGI